MTVQTVATFDEWANYAAQTDEPRAQAVGVLADQIRGRFGANKHVPVWLSGEVEYTGCADGCCNDTYVWWVIDCADSRHRLSADFAEIDPRQVRKDFIDWLDEPRRLAQEAAERETRREQAEAQERAVIDGLSTALTAVEAEGYRNAGEWHDNVMDQLGIGGVRYGRE